MSAEVNGDLAAGSVGVRALYSGPTDVALTWRRRSKGARAETEVVRRLLGRWLPPVPADLLDIGGGNGFFAFELAAVGYRVRLSDVTASLIEDARHRAAQVSHRPVAIDVADARRLPYPDASADAALLFGPMYGLRSPDERAAALAEARRVLRPGAVLAVENLTRAGGLRGLAHRDPAAVARIDVDRFAAEGVIAGPDLPAFYDGHVYLDPDEVSGELAAAGFALCDVVAVDGPDPLGQRALADAAPEVLDAWVALALRLGRQRSYWAAANHVVHIARPG